MRPEYDWHIGHGRSVALGRRTLVMGVLNVTPDSFSDGGRFGSAAEAIEAGLQMVEDGAAIVDVGGESTRPGVRVVADAAVSADEELRRVLPVIEGLRRAQPEILISVDTYKSEVARAAVGAGAAIVNDVSGFLWDPRMMAVAAELACGVVLMHTRGTPEEWKAQPNDPQIVEVVCADLQERARGAMKAGIPREFIVLDPGFGFGKRMDGNYPLLARFEQLQSLGFPLMAGLSRKSFLGGTVASARVNASVAAATVAAMKGAHIVRAHDVRATVEALAVVDALALH